MKKLEFKAEDFSEYDGLKGLQQVTANRANAILQDYLDKNAVRVYGRIVEHEGDPIWASQRMNRDTHTGLLICVEELKREPCKHERSAKFGKGQVTLGLRCEDC